MAPKYIMRKIGLVVVLCGFALWPRDVHAQKQNNIWYFGNGAGLDFNSGLPVALSDSKAAAFEGCSVMNDRNTGSFMFYVDGLITADDGTQGSSVWNRNHQIMPNGEHLYGSWSSTQSSMIVPMPQDSTKYYVFTTNHQGYYDGWFDTMSTHKRQLHYSIVDMTKDGGLGDVTVKNIKLLEPGTERLTAVRHCNGIDYWVISHQWNTNNFYAWLVTKDKIFNPVISSVGSSHGDGGIYNGDEGAGYLKSSHDGKKIAVAIFGKYRVEVFDFNNVTGSLSNPTSISIGSNDIASFGPYGCTFSPNDSLLYISTKRRINQYNLFAGGGNQDSIFYSGRRIFLSTDKPRYGERCFGAMQIARDGKIYIARRFSGYLSVINSPNSLGLACGFVENGINTHWDTDYGLPNFIEGLPDPAPILQASFSATGFDLGSPTVFTDRSANALSWDWNFGDTASGASNTSILQNPTHVYSGSGTYQVTLIVKNDCYTDTLTKTIVIKTLQTCPRPQAVNGTKPGEVSSISILLTNSEAAKNASSIGIEVKYDPDLLLVLDTPKTSFGNITSYNLDRGNGRLSFTLVLNRQLDTPNVKLAEIPVQALLAPKRKGTVEVTTSIITQQGGNSITTSSCSDTFLLDESCVFPEQLKSRNSINIVSLYPNPSSHSSTLLLQSTNEGDISFELVDIFGRSMFKEEKHLSQGQSQFTFSTQQFSAGMYFCRIMNGTKVETKSLSIQK